MILKRQYVTFSTTLIEKYINTMKYIVACQLAKKPVLADAPDKMIAILAYVPAYIFYLYRYGKGD